MTMKPVLDSWLYSVAVISAYGMLVATRFWNSRSSLPCQVPPHRLESLTTNWKKRKSFGSKNVTWYACCHHVTSLGFCLVQREKLNVVVCNFSSVWITWLKLCVWATWTTCRTTVDFPCLHILWRFQTPHLSSQLRSSFFGRSCKLANNLFCLLSGRIHKRLCFYKLCIHTLCFYVICFLKLSVYEVWTSFSRDLLLWTLFRRTLFLRALL